MSINLDNIDYIQTTVLARQKSKLYYLKSENLQKTQCKIFLNKFYPFKATNLRMDTLSNMKYKVKLTHYSLLLALFSQIILRYYPYILLTINKIGHLI